LIWLYNIREVQIVFEEVEMGDEKLIFAPLVRVSTERQEKQGESLSTQEKQLKAAIQGLGGSVHRWYRGHEHATPDQERKVLDDLMSDADAKKFDAVMVTDVSRWSRDNLKSTEYLAKLKAWGIRFFVGSNEFDLFNHFHDLILTMGVVINQFFAKEQVKKSNDNKVELARKGRPSCGKKPFGRIFDKETGIWTVDPHKKEIVEEAARLYLEEDIPFKELGNRFGMNEANLWKVLTQRSGDVWEQGFKVRSQGKEEKVVLQTAIPRLLPDDIIQKIKAKCEARRTWEHGAIKFEYLFSRMIFDGETKSRKNGSQDNIALTGTANAWNRRYYRPFRGPNENYPYKRYMINADILENAVLDALFEALSENRALYKAVFDGNPEDQRAEKLSKERAKYEKELKLVDKKLSNAESVILAYEKEDIQTFLQRMKGKVKDLEERQTELKANLLTLDYQIKNLPTEQEISNKREWMKKQLAQRMAESYFRSGLTFRDLAFRDKRSLINLIFGGRDVQGRRYGIYVTPIDNDEGPRRFKFEAYGRLGNIGGWLEDRTGDFRSYSDDLVVTPKDGDLAREAAEILRNGDKLHLHSECHAYHGLCLHQ
jgi:site-specific DNA recombinase